MNNLMIWLHRNLDGSLSRQSYLQVSFDFDLAEHNYVNEDLRSVRHWFRRNGLICNTKKTETMVTASQNAPKSTRYINIFYGNSILQQQKHSKYLGVAVDESLSWNNHVSYVTSRAYLKLKLLKRISSFLSPAILVSIYL